MRTSSSANFQPLPVADKSGRPRNKTRSNNQKREPAFNTAVIYIYILVTDLLACLQFMDLCKALPCPGVS